MIVIDRDIPLPDDNGALHRRFPFLANMRLGDSVLLDTNNSNIHDLRWSQKCHSTILKTYGWKPSIRTLKWDKKTPIQVRIWRTS